MIGCGAAARYARPVSDHDRAQDYWRSATDTFVADTSYYGSVAAALERMVLPQLPADATVLDIGCGDGTFTALLAHDARHVDAFDLSPDLIDAARARGLTNVQFEVGDAADVPTGSYDLVSCMGVLVCLVDDREFERVLTGAAACVAPGGLLLLRETIARRRTVHEDGDYVACYRTRRAYTEPLAARGLTLELDHRLATWSRLRSRTNHLWVFRRSSRAT